MKERTSFEGFFGDDCDEIPVRLPSGSKAIVRLPRPFTRKDATHLVQFLAAYIEENASKEADK